MLHFHDRMVMFRVAYPLGSGDPVSRYGDPVRGEEDGEVVPCQIRPQGRGMDRENMRGMDKRTSIYHVVCPPDLNFDGLARIEWEDRSFEVLGEPQPFNFRNGSHHTEFTMRAIEGG